jgi:hypothetical protein
MKFVPYHKLQDTPNIVVDGGPVASTRLVLSHWPHSGTPRALKADLSAQIVFNYLAQQEFHVDVPAVSNNHFDEDGLISMFSILHPDQALKQRDLLIDIASAGDFGTYRSRQAVRTFFTLSAFADREKSPLDKTIFEGPYPEIAAALYEQMLERLPDLLSGIDSYEQYWREQSDSLERSEQALKERLVRIEEIPDIDLAIVRIPDDLGIHPIAVNNSTNCFRILTLAGNRYTFAYRYETWVQYMSKRPLARVDLQPLAEMLSEEEGSAWIFDGVDSITPSLYKSDHRESLIPPERFIARLSTFFRNAPPAWDPYDV